MTVQFDQLVREVVKQSESNNWDEAKTEWNIVNLMEDKTEKSQCICGQPNLRYLYTIKNVKNGNTLFPIGSQCINQFKQDDLNNDVTTYRKLLELQQAVADRKFITLNTEYFSRDVLLYLYENGAFKPNKFNKHNPKNDYNFLLKIFNKHAQPSEKEQKKVTALIMNAIIPFAQARVKTNQLTISDLENWVDASDIGYILGSEDTFSFEAPDGKDICISWEELEDNDYGDINLLLSSDPSTFLNDSIDFAYNRNSIDFNDPECQDQNNDLSKEISEKIAACVNDKIVEDYKDLLE